MTPPSKRIWNKSGLREEEETTGVSGKQQTLSDSIS